MNPAKNHKILLVDDNPTNIAVLEEILEDYNLRCASSGESALNIAPEFEPDLILLDIMMPGIDGYEVCKKIRINQRLYRTKIIMVSAKAMIAERLKGYESGADDYITKPFEEDELLAKVQVYLNLKTEEEVNKIKSDFLKLLHLETNNPLNRIIVPVDTLIENPEMDLEDRDNWLQMIKRGAKSLQDLFAKITVLGKMKSRDWTYNFERVNLAELVRDEVAAAKDEAGRETIRLDVKIPNADLECTIDRELIKRIVRTLLNNAIRFSPENGVVSVILKSMSSKIYLTIADQGKGIDHNFLSYNLGDHLNVDSNDLKDGHGLNLAINREILNIHGGTLSIQSSYDTGTIVNVQLPVHSSVKRFA